MNLDQRSISAIGEYLAAPAEKKQLTGISGIYWKTLVDEITLAIHNKQPIDAFLSAEKDFVNFGITKEFFADADVACAAIANRTDDHPYIQIKFLSTWIQETFARISNADKKELLEKDIKRLEIELNQIYEEIEANQTARREFLMTEFSENFDTKIFALIENLDKTDALNRANMVTKRAVAKGLFMSVEDRRAFSGRNAQFQKETAKNEGLWNKLKTNEDKKKFREFSNGIVDLLEKSVVAEDSVNEKQRELLAIADQNLKLSPMEIENRVRTELEYVRDLTKLAARRLHMETCSLLKPDDKVFTLAIVYDCFDRIFEFDPLLLNNDRVSFIGKPSVLLVPGNGNALYDWKNNQIVIPLIPPGGNFMGSIATGIVEYRIDVDEEKKMMHSFQKIPENKLVKSIVTLRSNLTKDYLRWMTSEYSGFKVLSRESRTWFEHEIGPRKNEPVCPYEFQPFVMNQKSFAEALEAAKLRLKEPDYPDRPKDLWAAGVMSCQQGKHEDAIKYLEELTIKNPGHKFAWYNFGMLCMKNMRAQDAKNAFKNFMETGQRSWWTAVAAEHFRQLSDGM